MNATASRTPKQPKTEKPEWPKEVKPGRAIVRVYKRITANGNVGFMVANYAEDGKRKLDAYNNEAEALAAADTLAKRIDARDYVAASMTNDQAIEYANSNGRLRPFGVTLDDSTAVLVDCLRLVGTLAAMREACTDFASRRRLTTKKSVPDVVTEFLKIKVTRGASDRYKADLDGRLTRFAEDCNKDCCNVTTTDVQDWLDGLELSPQSYRNYRTVLHTFFAFAVSKGYAADNPVERTERVKVRNGDVHIFTPVQIARLLEAARTNYPDFLPCLAIGAFAGLRSAEIERLEWSDIQFADKLIVVSAGKAKTASRRIVPLHDCLAEWLRPYANREGKVWTNSSILFYKRQESVAAATKIKPDSEKNIDGQKQVEWKQNALRHSYASYRFALTGDAGRVGGELGNSAAVVHRHYKELVRPKEAEAWFSVKPPEVPSNVLPYPGAAVG